MKQLSLIGAAIVLAGIIIYAGIRAPVPSNSSNDSKSGIAGRVRLGPTCPVTIRSEPGTGECADKVFQTELELVDPDTETVIRRFSSDSNGEFTIEVEPGDYMIKSPSSGNPFPNCGKSGVVTVPRDRLVRVIVLCDTGIR